MLYEPSDVLFLYQILKQSAMDILHFEDWGGGGWRFLFTKKKSSKMFMGS